MNKRILGGLAALATFVVAPVTVLADGHESEPNLSSVWMFVPKTGMGAEFEAAVKEHTAFRRTNGDSRAWEMYSVAVGDKIGMYQVRFCCFDWADEDAYTAENADKNFGAHFGETVMPYVERMHHYIEEMDWENSVWPDDDTDYRYYGVTSWVWKEDAGPESGEAQEKLSSLAMEAGWGEENPWLWHSRVGGKPMLMIVTPHENYASMAPPEQNLVEFLAERTDATAEEIYGLFETFGSGFSSSDFTVWAYRPDLSVAED